MDWYIKNLMEYWKINLPRCLRKIADIIDENPKYFLSYYDPIRIIAKETIYDSHLKSELLETDAFDNKKEIIPSKGTSITSPIIKINKYKNSNPAIDFHAGFLRTFFSKNIPNYCKLGYLNDYNVIILEFSLNKKNGFYKLLQPSKTSRTYFRLNSIKGFLNFYQLNISNIIGIYRPNRGYKRDINNVNKFYLYPEKRDIEC